MKLELTPEEHSLLKKVIGGNIRDLEIVLRDNPMLLPSERKGLARDLEIHLEIQSKLTDGNQKSK